MATTPPVRFVLTARDVPAQFSEYDVYIGDRKVGMVVGSADRHYSKRLGRQATRWRVWSASTTDGHHTDTVHTRREAVTDLLRLTGEGQDR